MSIGLVAMPPRRRVSSRLLHCGDHVGVDLRHRVRDTERQGLVSFGQMPHRFPEREHVVRRVGEEADGVQALRVRQHSFRRDESVARLEAGDAAGPCGPEHGPARLRAEREGHHAGRDGSRGSLELPPGVCSRLRGLRVGAGVR